MRSHAQGHGKTAEFLVQRSIGGGGEPISITSGLHYQSRMVRL